MKLHEEFKLYENMWGETQNTKVLTEANFAQQLKGFLSFKKGMTCPGGCGETFNTEADYKNHINACNEIQNILYCRPAVAMAKKAGWSADVLPNISALIPLLYALLGRLHHCSHS